MRGLLTPKFLVITMLYTGMAFVMSLLCRGHAVEGAVPLLLLLALVFVTVVAGQLVSLVLAIATGFIFAMCLFEPYGSIAIRSGVDRIELFFFLVAAIGMALFSPYPEGMATTTLQRDSVHIRFLSFSGSRGAITRSESLQTWIAVVGYTGVLMAILTLLIYMWK